WGGVARDYTVTLGQRPADFGQAPAPGIKRMPGITQGMLSLFGMTAQLTDAGQAGDSLEDDSPFAAAGLQEGDVITQINGVDVTDAMGRDLMLSFKDGKPLTLTVLRDGTSNTLEVNLSDVLSEMMPDLDLPDFGGKGGLGFG